MIDAHAIRVRGRRRSSDPSIDRSDGRTSDRSEAKLIPTSSSDSCEIQCDTFLQTLPFMHKCDRDRIVPSLDYGDRGRQSRTRSWLYGYRDCHNSQIWAKIARCYRVTSIILTTPSSKRSTTWLPYRTLSIMGTFAFLNASAAHIHARPPLRLSHIDIRTEYVIHR